MPSDRSRGDPGSRLPPWLRRRSRIARREIASLGSEKTILLALMIQLFIAAFSSFLVVGLVSLYDPGSAGGDAPLEVGVVGNGTDAIVPVLADDEDLRYRTYEELNESLLDFTAGRTDGVLAVTRIGEHRFNVTAVAPRSSLQTTLVVTQLKEVLERFERENRDRLASELERRTVPVPSGSRSSPYFGFTYTVLIPLLMFLPVFISGSIVSDSLTEEIDRGTIELLRTAPVTDVGIVDGKMLAMAAIAPAQAALWLGLLAVNGTAIAHPVALLCFVAAVAAAVVGAGAAIAVLFRERRQAQFVYSAGIIAAFAGSSWLPESPANTVALLAVGSADATTAASVGFYAVVAVGVYVAVRWFVARRPIA